MEHFLTIFIYVRLYIYSFALFILLFICRISDKVTLQIQISFVNLIVFENEPY